jgi:uncharacterized glyoxalase superfamily protein PhnB
MAVQPVPKGYNTITPMLVADNAAALLDFVKQSFDTETLTWVNKRDGSLMAIDLRVGTSSLTICAAGATMPATKSVLYLYVPDSDSQYRRCLSSGGKSLMEPNDEPHGDRMSGIEDPAGNQWWIATRQEDVPQPELEQRMQQHMAQIEEQNAAG